MLTLILVGGSNKHVIELIYASAAVRPIPLEELRRLLTRSRVNNEKLGLTGMLLHDRGSFLQVLEGDAVAVKALFATIAKDPRHGRIAKLLESPIGKRSFESWKMGFVSLDGHRLRSTEGFSEILSAAFSVDSFLSDHVHGAARQVLLAFRKGRLRASVEV